MIRMTRRLGFGISLLVHLGLLGGLWLWQQQGPSEAAVPVQVVSVELTMFSEAPPAPAPVATAAVPPEPPVAAPVRKPVEPRDEAAVPKAVEPPPQPQVVKAVPRPDAAKARPVARPVPIEPRPAPARPSPTSTTTHRPASAEAVPAAATPAQSVAPMPPAAAPRTAQMMRLRDNYKAALLAAIERHKFYPNRARRRRIEGQARVSFRVTADGRIERIVLADGSGVALLDQAALQTIERLGRMAPLPPALGMDHWDLVVPIDFKLL